MLVKRRTYMLNACFWWTLFAVCWASCTHSSSFFTSTLDTAYLLPLLLLELDTLSINTTRIPRRCPRKPPINRIYGSFGKKFVEDEVVQVVMKFSDNPNLCSHFWSLTDAQRSALIRALIGTI